MSFLSKLQNIDRRVIYVIVLLALAIPMINPLGIPLSVSPLTEDVYNLVESLQPGDTVLLSLDYSPGGSPDVHPQAVAVAEHLYRKGVKMVMVSFWDAGPMYGEQILKTYEEQGLVYGTDVVNLGYISGGEPAIRQFGFDVPGTVKVDFRGQNTAGMPIMEGIKDARDFDLVIDFVSGNPGINEWVRQVQGPLGIKLAAGAVTVNVPQTMPFVQSGQVLGLLQGLRGAAEYEILIGAPGSAAAGMDAQSLGHLVIISFIIIGNVAFLLDKKQK